MLRPVVSDDLADQSARAIIARARIGEVVDDEIFVTDLNQVWRIRTGETGGSALQIGTTTDNHYDNDKNSCNDHAPPAVLRMGKR